MSRLVSRTARVWSAVASIALMGTTFARPVSATMNAQPYTLQDGNSSVTINPTSQDGNSSWIVDGVDHFGGTHQGQQWFWYSIGDAAPHSIDTLNNTRNIFLGSILTSEYAGAGFDLELKSILTGGSPGSGTAALSETATIISTSQDPLSFHFYEYADFNVNGNAADNTLTLSGAPTNTADQTDPLGALAEVSVSPEPDYFQVGTGQTIKMELNNGSTPVTLNDSLGPITGDANFAFQWNKVLSGDDSTLQISINKTISNSAVAIPLPGAAWSSLAMFGIIGTFVFCRRPRLAA